jgi:hypothetical protein
MTREKGGGKWKTGGNGEDDTKGDTSGKGPHNNNTSILDPPPPPPIEGRKARGVRNEASAVNLGTPILTVRELCAQFQTPPPLRLKVEW